MNKRIRKKLMKRHGFFHYSQYREHVEFITFGIHKFGKRFVDLCHDKEEGYTRTLIVVTKNRKGKIIDMDIYRNCYPSSISMGVNENG